MPRPIPNPAGDDVIGEVDGTLREVSGTLKTVDGTLKTVSGTLKSVESTLGEATDVLSAVRSLLTELEVEVRLVRRVPEIAAQVREIHQLLSKTAPT